eukprot:TRINITY_DN934_c0_g1_i3.p1 TRINITY_DN934_c0_g1~~TRINITY_DN934_c0_g1_i3.p1  ORF type:complete len:221 (+),score=33.70 TRINITY_DN934_c0_g1_i3:163-825(+)
MGDAHTHNVKVMVVGDAGVGKSTLITAYTTKEYRRDEHPTAVTKTQLIPVYYGGATVNTTICDVAVGPGEPDKLRPLIYPGTDVVIICFSVSNPNSFDNVDAVWVPEIRAHLPKAPIVLVATKKDERMADGEKVLKLKTWNVPPIAHEQGVAKQKLIQAAAYVESCAATMEGVQEVVLAAARTQEHGPLGVIPKLLVRISSLRRIGRPTLDPPAENCTIL